MLESAILIHFEDATGIVTVEAEGFPGPVCLEITQPFETVLGTVGEGDRTLKPEIEVRNNQRITQQQNQQRH